MKTLVLSSLVAATFCSAAMAEQSAPAIAHAAPAQAALLPVPVSPRLALRLARSLERASQANKAAPRAAIRSEIRALRAAYRLEAADFTRAPGSAQRRR